MQSNTSNKMKRNSGTIAVLVALTLSLASPAGTSAQQVTPRNPVAPAAAQTSPPTDETPRFWFVELRSAPAADGTAAPTLRREKDDFRANAAAEGLRYRERFAYDTLFNGFSIEMGKDQLTTLRRIPSVKAIYPVFPVSLPPRSTTDPDLATALAMTGADVAQSELGYTGAGIRVAVMDTGVDYHHPDLGGCFGDGCRVAAGYDFVGDAFNADSSSPSYNPNPAPDPDPDDCNGHGTHVAGIVGAGGKVTGVAPAVTFGAYRVFGCQGSTFADIMILAMERVLADGMQVLNMSIGSAFQWPQYPTAQASDRLARRGVVVVASIGNSGANGVYAAGAPGVGERVIGVASFDNTHVSAMAFTVNQSGRRVPYLPLSGTPPPPPPPTSGASPEVVYVGRGCVNPLQPYLADPAGKVALIERGDCTFEEKYQRAADAGAVGVIIHNNAPGIFSGGGIVSRGIFAIAISQADGLHVLTFPSAVTLTWTDARVPAPLPTGGLISSFSSYGLAPDLSLKPDIGAPGGFIRSTLPLEQGAYGILSGTSMSAPHVAGAAALLLQAWPRTRPLEVRTLLQNSADPRPWLGNPEIGFLDLVHRQGAGMLDIDDAILARAAVEPSKLALGEGEGGPVTQTLTISSRERSSRERQPARPVTYTLSHEPALASYGSTFTPSFSFAPASVAFSSSSVTVPPRGSATVDVTISAPGNLPDRGLYGGYIVFTPEDGGPAFRAPYAGFKGDYQSIQALTPTPAGFPWLARKVGPGSTLASFRNLPDGGTFTLQGDDQIPHILFHLDHQVQRLELRILDADTGQPIHPRFPNALEIPYFHRNSTPTGFFAFSWDGTRIHRDGTRAVPNGRYRIMVWVLKAMGDPNFQAHVETWTSPVITLARP